MQQLMSSPVPQHVRRPHSSNQETAPFRQAGQNRDLRWHLLDLVRLCRDPLGLRDRDITVLRGLLTLVPASAERERLVVFASNRVLTERCDGIDERTLRRRILHLQEKGLLTRKLSPNGKRYQVRDETADARLTYGIDLSPLFLIEDHLEALAENWKTEQLRRSALRAVVRDILYHNADVIATELCEQARLSLRRVLTSVELQEIIERMRDWLPENPPKLPVPTAQLSASRSQNDRHIHSSDKDSYDSECTDPDTHAAEPQSVCAPKKHKVVHDMTVEDCIDLAPNAIEFAGHRPKTWPDLIDLSSLLAPAIGLSKTAVDAGRIHLGAHGCALAILGLVEAFGRIRNPQAYFHCLTKQAQAHGLDFIRMFRSLAKPQRSNIRLG